MQRLKNRVIVRKTQDGPKLEILQPERRIAILSSFKDGARLWEFFDPVYKKPQRSGQQNRYYWGVVIDLISARDASGYTPDEAHDALRHHFLTDHTNPEFPRVRSTTELDTAEFEYYLECCRRLAAEIWGIYIPLPNEVDF